MNHEWGNEEREGKNPLEKGTLMDLEIKNEEYAFQVIPYSYNTVISISIIDSFEWRTIRIFRP